MNERIKELELQCYVTITKAGLDGHHEKTTTTFDKEKFAELIVKECCDWIDGSPSTDAGQLLLTKSFIIANLKGHFGVEN